MKTVLRKHSWIDINEWWIELERLYYEEKGKAIDRMYKTTPPKKKSGK